MLVTCQDIGFSIDARIARFEDFDQITKTTPEKSMVSFFIFLQFEVFLKVLLGAIVDVELVKPTLVVPEGVVIGVRHFITVPSCPEVTQSVRRQGSCHNIVKLTKQGGRFELTVVDSFSDITSAYFYTDKFQGHELCEVTTSWLPWGKEKTECKHSSLKHVIVTKDRDMCPHQRFALSVYC